MGGRTGREARESLVAGFVHEQLSMERLEEVLQIMEKARAGAVDVACACGLGRRDTGTAEKLMRRYRRLTDGAPHPGEVP